ncbi:MAG: type I DNA topoisomerase [Chloroflexi bacterium]|nr:type I DNA topoisomerase [Chloroflexota bacterium]
MAKPLVIVESPAKARTVGQMLGGRYTVKASVGHIRDLPKSELGVDVEKAFTPKYVIPKEKRKVVQELKDLAQKAREVFLATDPDREGEAISWHLSQAMGLDTDKARRVVFHEITPEAVAAAFRHPRSIDSRLVDAQQARRILDRLVGYKLSPLLWRKVKGRLSAGRVQSAALRLVANREREIAAHQPEEYWHIEAELTPTGPRDWPFRALLVALQGQRKKLEIGDEATATALVQELEKASYRVSSVAIKETKRRPAPPFITSTLQQEAWRKLGFAAQRTMALAQQLYEGLPLDKKGSAGLITYMRTDSTRVAASALEEIRGFIVEKYGRDYLPPKARVFAKKAKGAQEAHEAIRPTAIDRTPEALKPYLTSEQARLYELIWKRMLASQMAEARLEQTTAEIAAHPAAGGREYLLRATGTKVLFPGFLTLYREGRDEEEEEERPPLPTLKEDETLRLLGLFPAQHFTQPPPHYSEASLIRALEEHGVGRPSTYATIVSTLQGRRYLQREKGKLLTTELGLTVNDLLVEHFPEIMDIAFTAHLEAELDEIAAGDRQMVSTLEEFYHPFIRRVEDARTQMKVVKAPPQPTGEACEKCGQPLVLKEGRFGPFIACSGFPKCRNTRPVKTTVGVPCPQCGGDIVERRGRRGRPFYGCSNYPKCDFATSRHPLPQPCPHCGGLMVEDKDGAKCLKCQTRTAPAKAKIAAPA